MQQHYTSTSNLDCTFHKREKKEEAAAAGNIPLSPPSSMACVVTVHFGDSNLFPNHCVWTCHYVVMNSVECPSGIQSSNAHLISACKGYRYWSNCLGNAEQKVLGIQSAWWPFGASCIYKYGTVGFQKVEFSCYYKLCTSAHLSRRPWIKDCLGMCRSFSYPRFFNNTPKLVYCIYNQLKQKLSFKVEAHG